MLLAAAARHCQQLDSNWEYGYVASCKEGASAFDYYYLRMVTTFYYRWSQVSFMIRKRAKSFPDRCTVSVYF